MSPKKIQLTKILVFVAVLSLLIPNLVVPHAGAQNSTLVPDPFISEEDNEKRLGIGGDAPDIATRAAPTREGTLSLVKEFDKVVKDFDTRENPLPRLLQEEQDLEEELDELDDTLVEKRKDLDTTVAAVKTNERRLTGLQSEYEELNLYMRDLALNLYMNKGTETPFFVSTEKSYAELVAMNSAQVGVSFMREKRNETKQEIEETENKILEQNDKVEEIKKDTKSLELAIEETRNDLRNVRELITIEENSDQELFETALLWQQRIVEELRLSGQPANSGKDPTLRVLSESVLTPEELVSWFEATRDGRVNRGVNVEEIAYLFVEEGNRLGVRGDMAFIQAVLETGNFEFTGTNNFAGIGHCDSCPRGYPYRTAQEGVQAQIQLLWGYANPQASQKDLPWNSPPGVNVDTLGVKGCCYTWWGLSGTWASALHYGGTMLKMYDEALAHNNKTLDR